MLAEPSLLGQQWRSLEKEPGDIERGETRHDARTDRGDELTHLEGTAVNVALESRRVAGCTILLVSHTSRKGTAKVRRGRNLQTCAARRGAPARAVTAGGRECD